MENVQYKSNWHKKKKKSLERPCKIKDKFVSSQKGPFSIMYICKWWKIYKSRESW